MSLLGFLFRTKNSNFKDSESLETENYEPPKKEWDRANFLLKEAVSFKKNNIDMAIKLLREAYQLDEKYDLRLNSDKYTRLPKYLQNAGRSQDALNEMGKLFAYGTPLSKQSYQDLSDHLSECHSANAIIWKKQKKPNIEIAGEKCLSEIYTLNSVMWAHKSRLEEILEFDTKESEIYREREKIYSKMSSDNMSRIESLYPEITNSLKLVDLKLPVKNLDEQLIYDAVGLQLSKNISKIPS